MSASFSVVSAHRTAALGPTQYTITIVKSVERLTGPSRCRSQLAGFRRQGMVRQSAKFVVRQIVLSIVFGTARSRCRSRVWISKRTGEREITPDR
jgi:hypothetical protein